MPRLLQIIENLTNWYIRFNRKRLKGAAGLDTEDTEAALDTLFHVLFIIIRALAPFTPFVTEHIYGMLKPYLGDALSEFNDSRSIHFLPFPTVHEAFFNEEIERKVSAMQQVIQLARPIRERHNIALKTPLVSIVVISDTQTLSDLQSLQSYLTEELNVLDVILTDDQDKYGISLSARVDWPTLGRKLKKNVQTIRKALPNLTQDQLRQYVVEKKIIIEGIELDENDLSIVRVHSNVKPNELSDSDGPKWEAAFSGDLIVLVNIATRPEFLDETLARDIMSRVQRLRKKAGLVPTDEVRMQYRVVSNPDDVDVDAVITSRLPLFKSSLHGDLEKMGDQAEGGTTIFEEKHNIGSLVLSLRLLNV